MSRKLTYSQNQRFAQSRDKHGSYLFTGPELETFGRGSIRIDYLYDLISGNVKEVTYQKGQSDQFFQRYRYDADNRLIKVSSSRSGHDSEVDAKYFYYPTGELARVELGEDQVQGIDYAYTLQGWVKAMNGSSIGDENNRGNFDMGEDARQASNNLHQRFGADAAAYTLGYYQGDYKSITSNPAIANMPPQYSTDLYNGNISYKISSLSNLSGQPLDVQASTYRYDQLNRLKSSDIFTAPNLLSSNQITNPVTGNRYKTSYSYDANGNISDLQRHDDQGSLIDHLSYHYHKKANGYSDDKNQLLYVDDAVSTPNLQSDLEDQKPGNYAYDATGNLIKDETAEIAQISWTAYGKVSEVIRSSGSTMPNLSFHYDASGNRVLKVVKPYNYLNDSLQWKYEYYVRDASGNILAVYEKNYDAQRSKQTLVLTEQPFYGSARLGVINRDLEINPDDTAASQYSRVMGRKVYEIQDQLGNVVTTVSDRKIAIEDPVNPGIILHYMSDVTSYSDYFPFGSVKPGRNGSVGIGYKYGFNGQESDDEITGEKNSYTAMFWQYDPRIVMRWNTDPVIFPDISPYAVFSNNPIFYNDPDGDCPECPDNAKEGDTHTWSDIEFTYSDGQWSHTLPDVNVSASGSSWTSESNEWDYNGTYEQYQQEYSEFADISQSEAPQLWDQKYSTGFFNQWDKEAKKEQERIAVKKMAWFIQGFTTSGAMGMGAFATGSSSLASPKTFNYTPRGTNYTNVFRSISEEEALSIQSTGQLSFKPGAMEAKQFWLSQQGLNNFNSTSFAGQHNLRITIPRSLIGQGRPINTQWQPDLHLGRAGTIENSTNLQIINSRIINLKVTPKP